VTAEDCTLIGGFLALSFGAGYWSCWASHSFRTVRRWLPLLDDPEGWSREEGEFREGVLECRRLLRMCGYRKY